MMPITSKDFSCHKKTKMENYLNLTVHYYLMTYNIKNGLVKKLILPLATASLTFNSCGEKQLPLEKYAPITKTDTSIFNQLNPGLKECLDTIYIIKKEDWNNCRPGVIGFALDNKIYLREDYSKEDLLHEAVHVRHTVLNKIGSKFSEKWEHLAKFDYKNNDVKSIYTPSKTLLSITWKDGTNGPKDGCLDPYSGKSMYEDVARFVESAVLYLKTPEEILEFAKDYNKEKIKNLSAIYPLHFCNSKDKRYKQKLDLLKEYDFITNAEYDNLSKNLGSLNYLLKK